ncbi:acetolactate synthase AlsS [Bombilactobacillus thymidiniphilus]|uniref:Acetolactate synthase AlsS n=1 Tax=Bombilactobacillus thymidiniphilus TaxID=2923363 RepID=A0ABY4PBR8_9LACO|nr:acetolactate synthase AlsS [Bombilactobacillus thymidiniphilus]UQS83194.1 acetolactate synthase AlsS [Bombilactobacillus thymidiniphilus]
MTTNSAASALVETMINYDIKYVFGIPGAKIDKLFEELEYNQSPNKPQLIIARHEQNAAFMAAAVGRLTGKPGVVLVTSGPGVANLATGLVTATSEGDPVIALGGQVQRDDLARLTHQSIPNQELLNPVTKYSVEVQDPDNLSEAFANAYQEALAAKNGAVFISIPQDVIDANVKREVMVKSPLVEQGVPAKDQLKSFVQEIKQAQMPVILAGMRASQQKATRALRTLLHDVALPIVETFQGAGVLSRDLENLFFGRVGLFRNQTGDTLLKQADLVITVGYDPIEYEARNWNKERQSKIIHLDSVVPELTQEYQPELILQGDIGDTLLALREILKGDYALSTSTKEHLLAIKKEFDDKDVPPTTQSNQGLHPLTIVNELQQHVSDQMVVTVDVGSHYIWMARHFRSYEPRHLLFSNGMQTLGVALPWAIAASLLDPKRKVVSVAGDGGFMFSSQELETAVRLHSNLVQLVWVDGYYDMVRFQEQSKYGQEAGVKFGPIDFVKFAESFGARGLRVDEQHDLSTILDEAFAISGPVVVEIPVDYSQNFKLNQNLLTDQFN